MRILITVVNGLVAGTGAWAYLNAETWVGAMFVAGLAGAIILYGEAIRRTMNAERDA